MIDYVEKWKVRLDETANKYYSDETKKYLLSYSSLSAPILRLDMLKIPQEILNQAAKFGSELMEEIEQVITHKKPIVHLNPFYGKYILNMFNYIKYTINQHLVVNECEKCICDGEHIGFVDMFGYRKDTKAKVVYEIKTASSFRIKKSWITQLAFYKQILYNNNKTANYEFILLILNKNTGNWKHRIINKSHLRTRQKVIKDFIEVMKGNYDN